MSTNKTKRGFLIQKQLFYESEVEKKTFTLTALGLEQHKPMKAYKGSLQAIFIPHFTIYLRTTENNALKTCF